MPADVQDPPSGSVGTSAQPSRQGTLPALAVATPTHSATSKSVSAYWGPPHGGSPPTPSESISNSATAASAQPPGLWSESSNAVPTAAQVAALQAQANQLTAQDGYSSRAAVNARATASDAATAYSSAHSLAEFQQEGEAAIAANNAAGAARQAAGLAQANANAAAQAENTAEFQQEGEAAIAANNAAGAARQAAGLAQANANAAAQAQNQAAWTKEINDNIAANNAAGAAREATGLAQANDNAAAQVKTPATSQQPLQTASLIVTPSVAGKSVPPVSNGATSSSAYSSNTTPSSSSANGLAPALAAGGTGEELALARAVGTAGQAAVSAVQNTARIPSLSGTASYRIPDILDEANGVIGEVKNVQYQSLTSQIQDDISYAKEMGYTFKLYVRSTTQLSGPLQQAVDDGEVVLEDIPGL